MNRIAKYFEKELREKGLYEKVSSLNAFVGDIHNHCGISYGYGTIENAVRFASSQLDFFSVTGHFAWPDMDDDEMLIPEDVKAYHRKGFEKLRRNWPHYMEVMKAAERRDFIPFLSYEYHSFHYGDHTIVCRNTDEELPPDPEGERDERLKNILEGDSSQTERFLAIPHHIGYKQGYRGINWSCFNENVSPVVEIVSMHGCAESEEARPPYLHTMGPRSALNTYQGGLSLGKHFGIVGSTDHHNAAPGSYGSGRTVVFLEKLTRDNVWAALRNRHTSACTGDPIEAMLFVNGAEAGDIASRHNGHITADGFVAGYDMLEKAELIQGGRVIASLHNESVTEESGRGYVSFRFGWGKKHMSAVWDVVLTAEKGSISGAGPRLRGIDMVDPLDVPADSADSIPSFSFDDGCVKLHAVTDGNPTAQTDSTDGFVIYTESDAILSCRVSVKWNGRCIIRTYSFPVSELRKGQMTEYVQGFVSPAVEVGRYRDENECIACLHADIDTECQDAVYLRAYQKNGDGVFTSPVSFR
ncbi:MAG: hypothetical protein ACI4NM_04070 [Bullifex sp.]